MTSKRMNLKNKNLKSFALITLRKNVYPNEKVVDTRTTKNSR